MPHPSQKPKPVNGSRINVWKAFRDIGVAMFTKGQFPIFVLCLVVFYLIYKLPDNEVKPVFIEIIHEFGNLHLVGHACSVLLAIGWFFNAKHLRRIHNEEMQRLTDERNKWQERSLHSGRLPSSHK